MRLHFLFILFFLALQSLYASVDTKYSLRKCMLLPLLGGDKEVGSFKIYKRVERYLKNSDWCHYRSNSNALTILQSYQPNLDDHLQKAEVLRKIADKTRAGSLIRIKMSTVIDGVKLSVKVIGDNGKDILFSEKINLKKKSIDLTFQMITDWLDVYKKTIPYDGRIIGVLDNQFTIDVGSAYEIPVGSRLQVVRPTEKKNHPLLNEIVGWEIEERGKGRVISSSEFQSLVEVIEHFSKHRPQLGDWVVVEKKLNNKYPPKITQHTKLKKKTSGHLGTLSVSTKIGNGSDATSISNQDYKIQGLIFGLHGEGELWMTRDYWLSLELERNIGIYYYESEDGESEFPQLTQDIVKFKLGYRYLPLGLFWGPQIDFYLGHGTYSYDIEVSRKRGLGHHKIQGALCGIRGNIPLHRFFRGFLKLDFLFFPSYEEETNIFGKDVKSRTSYQIELGGHYNYSSSATLDGSLEFTSNQARFAEDNGFNLKEMAINVGVTLIF